jgi:hypothetical protein
MTRTNPALPLPRPFSRQRSERESVEVSLYPIFVPPNKKSRNVEFKGVAFFKVSRPPLQNY